MRSPIPLNLPKPGGLCFAKQCATVRHDTERFRAEAGLITATRSDDVRFSA